MSYNGVAEIEVTEIPRIALKLRAGSATYDTVPDLSRLEPLRVLTPELRMLDLRPERLLAMRVRGQGMEPMLFEDDWVVIDIGDTVRRSGEVFAVNWNGEASIQQLVERGGQWYLSYVNTNFNPINIRSGELNIVGRVVFQPGRTITGRL
jgi:phage repressor protein C with HTH and peptisase S24 domain